MRLSTWQLRLGLGQWGSVVKVSLCEAVSRICSGSDDVDNASNSCDALDVDKESDLSDCVDDGDG